MAYTYKPNKYVIYDESLTFEENYQNDAVITKKKLDRLEQQVKENSAELTVGEVTFTKKPSEVGATVDFNKVEGTKRINFVLPAATGLADEEVEKIVKQAEDAVFAEVKCEPYVTEEGILYACGTPIIITKQDDETNLATWHTCDGRTKTLEFPVDKAVYGGDCRLGEDSYRVSYPATSIVMNSGKVNAIFGGGYGKCDVAVSTIVMNGGTVYTISGAGVSEENCDNTTGRTHIILNKAEGMPDVYGGSSIPFAKTGEALVEVNNGDYRFVILGSNNGYTTMGKVIVNGGNIDNLQGATGGGEVANCDFEINGGSITTFTVWGDMTSIVSSKVKITGGSITNMEPGMNFAEYNDITGTYVHGVIGNEEFLGDSFPALTTDTSNADLIAAINKVLEDANAYTDKKIKELDDIEGTIF